MFRLFSTVWTAAAAVALLSAAPAEADLRLCNEAYEELYAAYGYKENDLWVAEGWWQLTPGECATVVSGPLSSRYYYVRGEGVDGTVWGGDTYFCTMSNRFLLTDDPNCMSSTVDREGFDTIDTGEARDWTQNFTP
ncbi:MAG: DUF1036 domain-containing protein [Rhodobacteraceae bacterium]|nr:DUF1036 domain-containing protein [Paracoccaceae bacterium]